MEKISQINAHSHPQASCLCTLWNTISCFWWGTHCSDRRRNVAFHSRYKFWFKVRLQFCLWRLARSAKKKMWNGAGQSSLWKEFNNLKDERGPITAEVNDSKQVLWTSGWRKEIGFIAVKFSAGGQRRCFWVWTDGTPVLLEPHDSLSFQTRQPEVNRPVVLLPSSFVLSKRAWVLRLTAVRGCWPSQ